MYNSLPQHEVVLLGVGHANAHVLRQWGMAPPAGARLTCVAPFPTATYSGMLPAALAGLEPPERMEIDLVRLCAAAGARLIVAPALGVDPVGREVHFADRPPLPFDWLSIGVGSVPRLDGVEHDDGLLSVKPMQSFLDRLAAALKRLESSRPAEAAWRIAIVGGGAGGFEIACCLGPYLARHAARRRCELTLVDTHPELLRGMAPRTVRRAREELERLGVRLVLGQAVVRAAEGTVTLADGQQLAADLTLWAASAGPPPLLEACGLPRDERGFLRVEPTLHAGDAPVFVVGDCASLTSGALPKAGVYAVRQGPVLWENLRRALAGMPLVPYQPQRRFLKLLNLGDGRALGECYGWTARGRWCWRWKTRIDGRFMDMYQKLPSPIAMAGPAKDSPPPMRCLGCGGKVSGSVLSRALSRLENPPSPDFPLGLDAPDDVALYQPPAGRLVAATVDFFAAPLDDAYLVGRLAALHAASDAFACLARPRGALAVITLPYGSERRQEQLLFELLAGALREFRAMDVALVGGHTIEGPQLTVGFALLAEASREKLQTKAGLRPGDALVLTKPLGSGVLLAAWPQARLKASWRQPLVEAMLRSNGPAAQVLETHAPTALTDVTGFGLAGHLLEMLEAGNVAAELRLDAVPWLPGAAELFSSGLESTLAPANRAAERELETSPARRAEAAFAGLFDPQTCGGLLCGVPSAQADRLLAELQACDAAPAARIIGRVLPADERRRLRVV